MAEVNIGLLKPASKNLQQDYQSLGNPHEHSLGG
jgi:hypothetical protein